MAILPYTTVHTAYFGPALLIKKYPHRDTREMVWDVKTPSGESLHLSERYVKKLLVNNK